MADAARAKARPLALTMGDPAGIGLDITLAAWSRHRAELPEFVLYADPEALADRARLLGLAPDLAVIEGANSPLAAKPGQMMVVAVPLERAAIAGRADARNAGAVIGSIERAVADTAAGRTAAIVTNPIAKATLHAAGFAYPGHTEFLGVLAKRHSPGAPSTPVMMLASDELRVVPLTVHLPLVDVPRAVTAAKLCETVRITAADLGRRFGIARPRLAVAGLNPHAGESGSLGREEIEIIGPAVAELREEGFDISGPHSADMLFHAAARARYDVAICMYHDQALIPLKTLAFDTGVNVTLGLPFVRTSPDHGTAFDIAGSGLANPASLVAALKLAAHMVAADAALRS